MILIGSVAASFCMPADLRETIDTDLVGTYDECCAYIKKQKAYIKAYYPINSGKSYAIKFNTGVIEEIEIAWENSRAAKFLEFMETQPRLAWGMEQPSIGIPELDVLYLLKMSHRYLKDSPHFLKTMKDIHTMRKHGAKIRPEHQAFYEERMRDTYVYAHPKLNVDKSAFFDNEATGVFQKYDHDSIHEAVKHYPQPAYNYFKKSDEDVLCSKDMFYNLPEEMKLCAVLEEAYVLALERSLIPFPSGKTPKEAFDMALMKVCTSITSGWFREYAWENYHKVQEFYNENYVQKFEDGVRSGVVTLNKREL
jgi:hypothetical protein